MRFLTCAFRSPGEFLASYSTRFPEGSIYCETRGDLEVDQDLLVEVTFPGLANPTLLRGSVSWLERGRGTWVRLHAGDAHGRDFLLGLARGEIAPSEQVERGHRRIPAALPVTCQIDEDDEPSPGRVVGHTRDLGGGGAFVHSATPPAVGTRLSLLIGPCSGGRNTFNLDGRVAWIRRDPRAHGFGVRFDSRGNGDTSRLRALLRHSCERGHFDLAT